MNEQALKDRLKHIAHIENKSFQEVWKLLLLERFLVRLAHSQYRDRLIFKGGMLLSYYMMIARETTDIDLLAQKLQANIPQLEKVLSEICTVNITDGFTISLQNIDELDHSHMNYPGFRAKLGVKFGSMKDRIQIDIGVGDIVDSKVITWPLYQYRGQPIFESMISLSAYPVETIFSEKLETIISRGAINSRMKDFHDIVLLCRKKELFNIEKLTHSIQATFQNRGTKITVPLIFSRAELNSLQAYWSEHLRVVGSEMNELLKLPSEISAVVDDVNRLLTGLYEQ